MKEATEHDIYRLTGKPTWKFGNCVYRIVRKIAPKTLCKYENIRTKEHVLDENKLERCEDIAQLFQHDIYFDGWWGDPKYRKTYMLQGCNDFCFSRELDREFQELLFRMNQVESVSIHVRRGDYVGSSFDCVGKKYYERAVRLIKKYIPHPYFFVFSDDTAYAERLFEDLTGKECISTNQGENSYKDMYLMSKCKHNIITNSSFSYWGAVLNRNPFKIIVCPQSPSNNALGFYSNEEWVHLNIL